MNRQILRVFNSNGTHMVGDGFKVRSLIPQAAQEWVSPFLMFDYNEPWKLEPSTKQRGVDVHPHKGFETVTIAWQGSVAHTDSTGSSGIIGPGDVQWMTAGSGILHKEYHATEFTNAGGVFHMAQLWVNLPQKYKLTSPSYQELKSQQMPAIELPNHSGTMRIVAGEQFDQIGAAKTFTRINLYDVQLNAGGKVAFSIPSGDNLAVAILSGSISANEEEIEQGNLVLYSQEENSVEFNSKSGTHFLLLSGEPINEPIFAHGPFVMNTKAEIIEAIEEFKSGKFGILD